MLRLKISLDFNSGWDHSLLTRREVRRFSRGVFCMTAVGRWRRWRLSKRRIWKMRFASWTCRSLETRWNRRPFVRYSCVTETYSRPRRLLCLGLSSDWTLWTGRTITKLNRPTFPKSSLEKELEVERVRELIDRGLLARSESPHATSNILVGKKRNADGVLGGCGSRQNSGCSMR
jgi:hypothetical protein